MSEILISIGKKIKQQRNKRKVSKLKLSSDLKIAAKYLNKVEDGTLDKELKPNHVIRYLALYLDYLEMDKVEIIKEYNNAFIKQKKNSLSAILAKNMIFNLDILSYSLILSLLFFGFLFYSDYSANQASLKNLTVENKILLQY